MLRQVEIHQPVRSIVSIVPSQTELLADLGLSETVTGVTKFCIHPHGFKNGKTIVGGTKTLKMDEIRKLRPDLIIGNKEENTQAEIEFLEKEFPVWMSDITSLDGSLEMIRMLGEITGTAEKAERIAAQIAAGFCELLPLKKKKSVLYLIWRTPYMAAGKGTFIDDCLTRCGFENCLSAERYPEPDLAAIRPDVILLSSEPYPFKEKHILELQQLFPSARVLLADGEYFSWYGSRLLGAPEYFSGLIKALEAEE